MVSLEEKTTSMTGKFVERVRALPWGVYTCIHLHTPAYTCIQVYPHTPVHTWCSPSVGICAGGRRVSRPVTTSTLANGSTSCTPTHRAPSREFGFTPVPYKSCTNFQFVCILDKICHFSPFLPFLPGSIWAF